MGNYSIINIWTALFGFKRKKLKHYSDFQITDNVTIVLSIFRLKFRHTVFVVVIPNSDNYTFDKSIRRPQ